MSRLQSHLKNTFIAGTFAAIPIAVTVFIVWYVETKTRMAFGVHYPFLGVVLAIAAIYVLGLIVTSLIGQMLLRRADRMLERMPVLREVYRAWKQVSLTPPGTTGIFAKVVLLGDEQMGLATIGFTSGDAVPGNPDLLCVFVPAAPNPTSGRIYFVRRSRCQLLPMPAEEAFKLILSGGTYVPPGIGGAGQQPLLTA
jgi:uncharacterized membrane protein